MKKNYYLKIFTSILIFFAIISQVHANAGISTADGYIRASIPGSDITAAFMKINNASDEAVTLQKITSPISNRIEIHQHSMANGMMKMRQIDNITIDAKSSILLEPSGLHIMIFSLKQPLTESDSVMLTLHFSNKIKLTIQLPVYRKK